jgi:hypothetical protein
MESSAMVGPMVVGSEEAPSKMGLTECGILCVPIGVANENEKKDKALLVTQEAHNLPNVN